ETGDEHGSVLDHGRAKARRKGADLLAVNAVGAGTGFGDVPNAVVVLDAAGEVVTEASGSKTDVARGLLDAVVALLARDADAAAPETSAAPTTLPRCPPACSPPSPSPRVIRTRSATRSPTRSSTRCCATTRTPGSPWR